MIEELIKEQIREIYLEAKEQAKKELLPVNQIFLAVLLGSLVAILFWLALSLRDKFL